MRRFTLLLIPDAETTGYTVEVPALPGCVTEGNTIEEALANAREAIAAWIKSAELDGEDTRKRSRLGWSASRLRLR